MKLFKSSKKIKTDIPVVNKTSLNKIYYGNNPLANKTDESQALLRKIKNRKRSVITPKVVFRKKHGIFKKILFLLLLLALGAFLIYKFELIEYFNVSFVEVRGADSFVSREDVKNLTERNSFEQSIFFIKEEEIVGILKKSFLGAKNIEIEKKFPNSLIVSVEERIPLAIVHNNDGDDFLIDSEGYVLGMVKEGFYDLPSINYEGSIVIGTFLEKDIIPISIEILKFAEQEDLKISSMSFYPNHTKLFVDRNVEVYMDYDKDSEKSLKTINALLKGSDPDEKMLKKIDLRYDKVIVLYD